ncbi:MAG: GNAT family N-acetyltransferase [Leptolyngbyaceae cyanobacterium MO_188.B28]|nr:GNAT family N-acetyltransferase [Leptolyngbyaceae cyanobacterium MO_188.B28]
MKVAIEYADEGDLDSLREHHHRVSAKVLKKKLLAEEVLVARCKGQIVGWLTYTLLYDTVPFINLLGVAEGCRGEGLGTQLVQFWEDEVKRAGADSVMTSSMANEQGQHFWRKLGYKDVGGVLLADEPLEVFFRKDFGKSGAAESGH